MAKPPAPKRRRLGRLRNTLIVLSLLLLAGFLTLFADPEEETTPATERVAEIQPEEPTTVDNTATTASKHTLSQCRPK